ncbi:hypothetical protein [Streptomyces sp. NPDC000134]|uniref:hypothetical protein n=1 Tax=Streptomyces sp. NPDC000134 TaxID=3364536 RepID=UPI0036B1946F
MFHQHASHPSALPHPSRVLTLADYGWDTERGLCDVAAETGTGDRVAVRPAGPADLLATGAVRGSDGLEHTFAQISRQVRALKQSPRFKA